MMTHADRVLREMEAPLAAGNVLEPVRACVAAVGSADLVDRRRLVARLCSVFARHGSSLTPAELSRVRRIIGGLPVLTAYDELARHVLLARLEGAAPKPLASQVGHASVLLVSEDTFLGERFGAVVTLEATVDLGGDERVMNRAARAALEGLYPAFTAALDYVAGAGHPTPELGALLRRCGFTVRLHTTARVDGASLGLGAAMAILSALLDLPIPANVAFTGQIQGDGRVRRVDHVMTKLRAAVDRGIGEVFLPGENRHIRAPECAVDPRSVDSLAEAAAIVFPSPRLPVAIAALGRRLADRPGRGPVLDLSGLDPRGRKVLITWVGRSDPVGAQRDRHGRRTGDEEEGPILTICRTIQPDAVYLLHTTGPDPENDYSDKASAVAAVMKRAWSGCDPMLVKLDDLPDITDYERLLPVVATTTEEILAAEAPRNASVFVNLTSGAPQMHAAWLVLRARRGLDATMLQVRETRYGASRVRVVEPPLL